MNVPPSHVMAQIWYFRIRGDFLKGHPSVRGKAVQPDGARHQTPVTAFRPHSSLFSSK